MILKLFSLLMLSSLLYGEEMKTHYFNVVLEARNQTVIYAEVTTPVNKVYKHLGDSFEEGELLLELDSRVFEGNFKKSEAAVIKFETELEAKKQLYADDALSKFELDDGISQLAGAQADKTIAAKLLSNTKILAPYAGKVVKVNVKEFELAQQGKELITLVDDAYLYARFLVPSPLLSCLKQGTPVDIYIKETGEKVSASLSRIAPVIDPASQTIMVEAGIDNNARTLLSGMTGRVALRDCREELRP
jgi:RND family efflux transporter MFP subunit